MSAQRAAGVCADRTLERREILADQFAHAAPKSGACLEYAGQDAADEFFPDQRVLAARGSARLRLRENLEGEALRIQCRGGGLSLGPRTSHAHVCADRFAPGA